MRRTNTQCAVCKKEIYRRPYQLNGNVFCSHRCNGNFRKKVERKCSCGVVLSGNKARCSRSCANKNRAGIRYRINQPRNKAERIKRLKIQLVEIRGPKCERCPYALVEILQVHHIIQRKDGGSDELENLELICPNCHAEEHFRRLNK